MTPNTILASPRGPNQPANIVSRRSASHSRKRQEDRQHPDYRETQQGIQHDLPAKTADVLPTPTAAPKITQVIRASVSPVPSAASSKLAAAISSRSHPNNKPPGEARDEPAAAKKLGEGETAGDGERDHGQLPPCLTDPIRGEPVKFQVAGCPGTSGPAQRRDQFQSLPPPDPMRKHRSCFPSCPDPGSQRHELRTESARRCRHSARFRRSATRGSVDGTASLVTTAFPSAASVGASIVAEQRDLDQRQALKYDPSNPETKQDG